MIGVDAALLEHVMVDFAARESAEHISPLITELLVDPSTSTQACTAVLAATVALAEAAGLLPDPLGPNGPAFYGIVIHHHQDPATLDDVARARHVATQALGAMLNHDTPTAVDLLLGPTSAGWKEATAAFTQCLVLWRSVVETPAGAEAYRRRTEATDGAQG